MIRASPNNERPMLSQCSDSGSNGGSSASANGSDSDSNGGSSDSDSYGSSSDSDSDDVPLAVRYNTIKDRQKDRGLVDDE